MLYKVGLRDDRIEKALKNKHIKSELEQLMKCFAYFEKAKSRRGFYEVEDGVTWDAIFCMRDLLRESSRGWQEKMQGVSKVLSEYCETDCAINRYK